MCQFGIFQKAGRGLDGQSFAFQEVKLLCVYCTLHVYQSHNWLLGWIYLFETVHTEILQ